MSLTNFLEARENKDVRQVFKEAFEKPKFKADLTDFVKPTCVHPGKEITKKHDAQSLIIENSFTHAFPRLLAKIAYGFAISKFGLGKMQKTYVLPVILGESKDMGRWVGCLPYSKQRTAGKGLHVLRLHMIDKKVVLAYVRLFASCDTPEYLVVVGTL